MSATQTSSFDVDEKSGPVPTESSTPTQFSWEHGPMELIPTPYHQTGATDDFTAAASEMALVHNCIIRALNSIYMQAPHIPAAEHTNFVKYCMATYQGLTSHHHGEEKHFFPEIERLTGDKGLMEANVEQHKVFETSFVAWGDWLQLVDSHKTDFRPDMCLSLMDDFIPSLSTHLSDEIATLTSLSRYSGMLDLRALMKAEAEKTMGGMSKTGVLPVFFLNHDCNFEGGWHNFPEMPAAVRWVLRSLCGRWHGEWWKFSTVTFDGRPRALMFTGEERL
jgi:hypothetical protein